MVQRFSVVVALLVSVTALAQQSNLDNASDHDRPWAKGVSDENQKKALELFRDGNSALRDGLSAKAAEKYNAALSFWDHPAIHYNLSLATASLDAPELTYKHLEAALKYGREPLDPEKFEQASRMKNIVAGSLAKVDIRCDLPGAEVSLDGKQLFIAPGRYEAMIRGGSHTVLAAKEGFIPTQQKRTFVPGEANLVELKLLTTADLTEYRRRWNVIMPWAVLGAGAAVAGGSVGLHLVAGNKFKEYDQGVKECAAMAAGCVPSPALQGTRSQADTMQALAIGGYALGGAALVTGGVLIYLNRLQPYSTRIDAPGAAPASADPEVSLVPVLGPTAAGAMLNVHF